MKRAIKKVIPQRVQTAVTGVRDSSILGDLDGKIFRPDGFAARIISAQYRDFVQGDHTTRRRHLASIYASELDRDKFYFPQSPDAVVHWLVFPVVMKNRHRHDDLEYESAEKLQVDIAPWMWPLALQQYPHLRKSVRQGIGTREATEMVAGMFNLPVHSQMDERTARRLVAWLNSSADA
jgi:dTDP-4-amino-4,6-dideoxygalactose transaminase